MTATVPAHERNKTRSPVARAWVAVVLTPIGLLGGVAVAYLVAAMIGVTLDPATGPGPTFAERLIVWSAACLAWLAAPLAAVVLARQPAREGNRSAVVALVIGSLLLALAVVLWVFAVAIP